MLGAMIYYLPKKHLREESYVGVLGLFGDNVPDGHGAACMSKLLLRNTFTYRNLHNAYYSFYFPVALAMYMVHVSQSYPSGT